jgi:hypothetical protein
MKRTPWFPACIKPVHIGVYEARIQVIEDRFGGYGIQGFSKWMGDGWSRVYCTPEEAQQACIRGAQPKAWRGIVKGASK